MKTHRVDLIDQKAKGVGNKYRTMRKYASEGPRKGHDRIDAEKATTTVQLKTNGRSIYAYNQIVLKVCAK